MKIWTDYANVVFALAAVSQAYKGNVTVDESSHSGAAIKKEGRAWRVKLRAVSSRGPGAKRAASGRRTVAVCWHVHREFMRAIYKGDSGARIQTALADYRDAQDFEQKHGETANKNIGSQFAPCAYVDACECDGAW